MTSFILLTEKNEKKKETNKKKKNAFKQIDSQTSFWRNIFNFRMKRTYENSRKILLYVEYHIKQNS